MASSVFNQWKVLSPESFVAGDGPFAAALAFILGVDSIGLRELRSGPQPGAGGSYPQVFEELKRVLLVVPESMSAADAVDCHGAAWNWVAKLSSAGDQHELAFVFILPPDASKEFEEAIAVGLGMRRIDPATTGHAVWRCSGSLTELLDLLASILPMDLLPLRARQAADTKRAALIELRNTVASKDTTAIRQAAQEALAAFSGHEYLFDVFCREPSHQNGNSLRKWLRKAVTEAVTQDGWMEERKQLVLWLAVEETRHV